MRRRLGLGLGLVCLGFSGSSYALCGAPWERLPEVGRELVRPVPLVLIGVAALPPLVLGPTGADYELRRFVQTDLGGSYSPEPVSLAAPYVVIGATALTYVVGALADSCPVQRQTSAMIQGIAGTAVLVGLTKFIVGRGWPTGGRDPYAQDRLDHPQDARAYTPFSRGLDAAFPSGHTAIMFAAAAAFRASAPAGSWWRFVGYPFAVGVGFGMWFGDHHWASDILSGALIGEAIGGAAGRAWASSPEKVEPAASAGAYLDWAFLPVPSGAALLVSGAY